MSAMNRSTRGARSAAVPAGLLGLVASCFAISAHAGLGESADSIARDHGALQAQTDNKTTTATYDRHEITMASGTRVREYLSKTGKVFAVSWSGPTLPDLKTVLAEHYADFVSAASAPRHNHHVLTISTPEFVLQNSRLPRGFAGHAHIPSLVPAGTSAAELN
jgi:Protein of unknown function (DUF2844)